MAIATAKRLGAIVEAYDVRRAAGEQVRSLGAKFLELEINAEGQGGYARELTPEEKAQEQQMVSAAVARADIVITTAAIPGRRAPLLVTKETVAMMRPGAVIVDLAAESGGNCELTRPARPSGNTVSLSSARRTSRPGYRSIQARCTQRTSSRSSRFSSTRTGYSYRSSPTRSLLRASLSTQAKSATGRHVTF